MQTRRRDDRSNAILSVFISLSCLSPIEISHGTQYTRTIVHHAAALIYFSLLLS